MPFLVLDRVYLEAVDENTFHASQSRRSDMLVHLCTLAMIAQDEIITMDLPEIGKFSFYVKLCDPVMRGRISMTTEVYIFRRKPNSTFVKKPTNGHDKIYTMDMSNDDIWLDYDFIQQRFGVGERERLFPSSPPAVHVDTTVISFADIPLGKIRPKIEEIFQSDDLTMLDLERIVLAPKSVFIDLGLLSGEQVMISGPNNTLRPVYLFLDPFLVKNMEGATSTQVKITEVLSYAVGFHPLVMRTSRSVQLIAPSNPGQTIDVPIANRITLARVASPLSQDKRLEASFTEELVKTLKESSRLVCVGDLIPVAIQPEISKVAFDTSHALHANDRENQTEAATPKDKEDKEDVNEEEVLKDELLYLKLLEKSIKPLHTSSEPKCIVYFKVTSMTTEADVEPPFALLDTKETRVEQMGVVHCEVTPEITATITRKVGCELYDLFRAFFIHMNHNNDNYENPMLRMVPSVLIYGKNGIGKRYLIKQVAAHLGVHILDIDCYTLIDDVPSKTDANIIQVMNQAGNNAPCILCFSSIDAIGSKSMSERGQGLHSLLLFLI